MEYSAFWALSGLEGWLPEYTSPRHNRSRHTDWHLSDRTWQPNECVRISDDIVTCTMPNIGWAFQPKNVEGHFKKRSFDLFFLDWGKLQTSLAIWIISKRWGYAVCAVGYSEDPDPALVSSCLSKQLPDWEVISGNLHIRWPTFELH